MQILQHAPGRWLVEGSKGQAYHVKTYKGPIHVESSDDNTKYAILIGDKWACDCWGSIYRGKCRHIEAVRIATSEGKPKCL